jgi:hypothetical protein
MIRILALSALLLFRSQGDDPEAGQPAHCDNYLKTPAAHRCQCGRAIQKCTSPADPPEDVRMDRKCKTFCREQRCLCQGTRCNG